MDNKSFSFAETFPPQLIYLSEILELAKNNQTSEIEKIARNLMSQQGLDFDKEFLAFKQNLGT